MKIGDRYEGEWKECLKHGNGTDIFANGDTYIGQYKDGKPFGYGQYIWKNGSTYTGEFQNGLKYGFGKYRKSKESRTNMYEGQYFKDKKQGFGIFKWASGNIYRGQYKSDEREGIGEMRWTDGSLYIGQWERGIQHGYGKMIFPEGTIKEGYFDNNVYKGPIKRSQIPPEFLNPNFNIMALAPRDIFFSEEIKSFYPAVRPYNDSPLHYPMTTPDDDTDTNTIGIRTKYSMPPVAQNKHKSRSFSREHRPQYIYPRAKNDSKQGTPARSASYINRSKGALSNSSRALTGHLSSKLIRHNKSGNSSTLYAPSYNGTSPIKLRQIMQPQQFPQNLHQRSSKSKRVWVPSGKVHYKEILPSARHKYFT